MRSSKKLLTVIYEVLRNMFTILFCSSTINVQFHSFLFFEKTSQLVKHSRSEKLFSINFHSVRNMRSILNKNLFGQSWGKGGGHHQHQIFRRLFPQYILSRSLRSKFTYQKMKANVIIDKLTFFNFLYSSFVNINNIFRRFFMENRFFSSPFQKENEWEFRFLYDWCRNRYFEWHFYTLLKKYLFLY